MQRASSAGTSRSGGRALTIKLTTNKVESAMSSSSISKIENNTGALAEVADIIVAIRILTLELIKRFVHNKTHFIVVDRNEGRRGRGIELALDSYIGT